MADIWPQRADPHAALRRARHAGPLRRPPDRRPRPLQRLGAGQGNFRAAAAAVPRRGAPDAARRARAARLLQQRVRARHARGAGRRPRLLLPLAVPLRLARHRASRWPSRRRRCGRRCRSRCAATGASTAAPRGGYGLDRQLAHHAGADPALLGARRADRAPAGGRRALRSRRAGGEDLLFVGELTRHKRVELALEAAELAGRRIRVVGDGPELPRLRRRFQRSAQFLGPRRRRRARRTCTPPAARSSCPASRSSGSPRSRRRPPGGR